MPGPGYTSFKLAFEISPIYLTGGVAGQLSGGTIPLISYTESLNFASLTSGGGDLNLDDFFAHWQPMPGTALVSNAIGTYPFANQQTAANAIITQPLQISMMMICPAKLPGDYSRKFAVLSALKATIDQHNISGGTYSIATPSVLYTDCVMTGIRDASGGESHQAQFRWQWDFQKPLITLSDAAGAQNNLMSKISSGTKITPNGNDQVTFSNLDITAGDPSSGVAPQVVPPSGTLSGISTVGPSPSGIPSSSDAIQIP